MARRRSAGTLSCVGEAVDLGVAVGQELMERRVEQPDADRIALHGAEDRLEVAALHRQQLGERLAAARLVLGHDHLAHGGEPVALEEHVLRPAEADALGAEVATAMRVGRRVGVDADPDVPQVVGPLHEPLKSPDISGAISAACPA